MRWCPREPNGGWAKPNGAIVKIMMMKNIKALNLRGLADIRQAATASFAAKNRTCNRGGISPMQAVTGRNNVLPGSLMEQLSSGKVRFRFNEALDHSEAIAKAERIRMGAIEPTVYDPPSSRKGLSRRLQDNLWWSGPGIVVCVEKDKPIPQRLWIRLRGRVKAYPLERVRLATADEATSADFVKQALDDVAAELQGGNALVEDHGDGNLETVQEHEEEETPASLDHLPGSEPACESPDEDERANQRLVDDVPHCVRQQLAENKKRESEEAMDPHALEFAKKQKLFEALSKQVGAPSTLQEAALRNRLEQSYAKMATR